jgi:NADH:ubiquinone oxidoreductase subunit K
MMLMAAKVVLAALISLGLMTVGVATVHVAGAESAYRAGANAELSADCSDGSEAGGRCEGAERRGHLAWNAASWLIGLALVVAVGRRHGTPGQSAM